MPANDASWFAVKPFLEKYALRHPDVDLVQLDARPDAFLQSVAEGPFAELLEYFRAQQICVRVAAFKPADLPAIVLYPEGAETVREAREALRDGELPQGLAGLVGDYVACWLLRHAMTTEANVLELLGSLRKQDFVHGHRQSSESSEQRQFVASWRQGC